MQTGRLKIAKHLVDVFDEIHLYHRDNGKLVKEMDDLISAIRYGMMMIRHAATHTIQQIALDSYPVDY